MVGGDGSDVFGFTYLGGTLLGDDHVVDFVSGVDKISFEASNFSPSNLTVTSLQSGETLISVDVDGNGTADFTITLDNGVIPAASDYIF